MGNFCKAMPIFRCPLYNFSFMSPPKEVLIREVPRLGRVSYRIFCWRGEIWCALAHEF